MNPLSQSQIKTLDSINCADLRRKIDELVKFCNKTDERLKECEKDVDMFDCGYTKDDEGKIEIYGLCDCPEKCQLHDLAKKINKFL